MYLYVPTVQLDDEEDTPAEPLPDTSNGGYPAAEPSGALQ